MLLGKPILFGHIYLTNQIKDLSTILILVSSYKPYRSWIIPNNTILLVQYYIHNTIIALDIKWPSSLELPRIINVELAPLSISVQFRDVTALTLSSDALYYEGNLKEKPQSFYHFQSLYWLIYALYIFKTILPWILHRNRISNKTLKSNDNIYLGFLILLEWSIVECTFLLLNFPFAITQKIHDTRMYKVRKKEKETVMIWLGFGHIIFQSLWDFYYRNGDGSSDRKQVRWIITTFEWLSSLEHHLSWTFNE